jgi:hypothetical protein
VQLKQVGPVKQFFQLNVQSENWDFALNYLEKESVKIWDKRFWFSFLECLWWLLSFFLRLPIIGKRCYERHGKLM